MFWKDRIDVDPEFTESNSLDGVANLISVLRICEQIETSKETIEKKSDQGECNDGILAMKILDYIGMAPEPTAKPLRYAMYVRKSSEDAEAQAKSLPE